MKELRRREIFWQYKLDLCFPHGLNERNIPSEYDRIKKKNVYKTRLHDPNYSKLTNIVEIN